MLKCVLFTALALLNLLSLFELNFSSLLYDKSKKTIPIPGFPIAPFTHQAQEH